MRTPNAAACAALLLLCAPSIATAAGSSMSGNGALALAALVGLHSPTLSAGARRQLGNMLDGRPGSTPTPPIVVTADLVSCRASDVDITSHACTLTFGTAKRSLAGRAAHELYATLVENGVPSDGAAGSIYEAMSQLACTIKPAEVQQRGGGGADCTFSPGP